MACQGKIQISDLNVDLPRFVIFLVGFDSCRDMFWNKCWGRLSFWSFTIWRNSTYAFWHERYGCRGDWSTMMRPDDPNYIAVDDFYWWGNSCWLSMHCIGWSWTLVVPSGPLDGRIEEYELKLLWKKKSWKAEQYRMALNRLKWKGWTNIAD